MERWNFAIAFPSNYFIRNKLFFLSLFLARSNHDNIALWAYHMDFKKYSQSRKSTQYLIFFYKYKHSSITELQYDHFYFIMPSLNLSCLNIT